MNNELNPEQPKPHLPPDLLEWARNQFSDEEIAAGIEDIRRNGGMELRDFIQELEEIVAANDGNSN